MVPATDPLMFVSILQEESLNKRIGKYESKMDGASKSEKSSYEDKVRAVAVSYSTLHLLYLVNPIYTQQNLAIRRISTRVSIANFYNTETTVITTTLA